MKKIFNWMAIIALVFTFLPVSASVQAQEEFVFITRMSGDPNNFNPDMRTDDNAYAVNQNVFNRLVKLNSENSYVADLATDWEYSGDNMQLTFNLKEGVTWHDGEPFTSADVKWTYETIMAESWAKSDVFGTVESIEAPDDLTVVFNMSTPDASFISKLSWYATFIMPQHLYEGTDYATNPANMNPVGTGPFKFESYESGVAVSLVKNENYFGQVPEIDTLIFSIIPDESTAYQAYIQGEIDHMGSLPTAEQNSLDGNPDYEIIEQLGINRTYLTYNLENEAFQNPELRKAIALAIDQQSIFDRVSGGTGGVAKTLISPVFTDYVDENITLPETDVDLAIETLENAGYERNENNYFVEFQLDVFESGNFADIATVIKANLEKAGIGVNINLMEVSAWQTKVIEDSDFELAMLAGYQGPDVSGIDGRVKSTGSTNIAHYNNPEVDELLTKGAEYSAVEDRQPYYQQVQEILAEDLPIILILDNGYKTPIKNTFSGLPEQVPDKAAASEYTYVTRNE